MTFNPSDEQRIALDAIQIFLHYSDDQFFGLWGSAGTGKTTLIQEALRYYVEEHSVLFCAPTHKATKVLRQKGVRAGLTQCNYSTLHSALGLKQDIDEDGNISFIQNPDKSGLSNYDLVVLDEVSMVGSLLWEQTKISLKGCTKMICMGDRAQLPPVNDDEAVNDDGVNESPVFSQMDQVVELIHPQRYSGAISDYAKEVRSSLNNEQPVVYGRYLGRDDTLKELLARKWLIRWKEHLSEQFEHDLSTDYVKAVCYTNNAVAKLNEEARSHLFPDATGCFHPGDRLILKQPMVMNGVIRLSNRSEVTVIEAERIKLPIEIQLPGGNTSELSIDCWEMLIKCEAGIRYSMYCLDFKQPCKNFAKAKNALQILAKKEKTKDRWRQYYEFVEQFCEVQYGFAITTHSAQGSTYDYTYVAYHDLMRNRNYRERNQLIYTAVTRAAKSCILSI